MRVIELLRKSYDRHQDKFNDDVTKLRDAMLLSATECDELLVVINELLPGDGNKIVHHLRQSLCEATDVIRCENCLANMADFT